MQSDKLNKNAPAHPTNVQQPAAAIPHDEVSLKQSNGQKQTPAPTQVKQGNTVTLTQVGHPLSSGMPAFGHYQWSRRRAQMFTAAPSVLLHCSHVQGLLYFTAVPTEKLSRRRPKTH